MTVSAGALFWLYLLVGAIYVILAYVDVLGEVLEDFRDSSEYKDVCALIGEGFTNTICAAGLVFMFAWMALCWPYFLVVEGV